MRLKTHKQNNKTYVAFTLVELMVVVAVIGIIAGIVLAAAGGAQKKRRGTKPRWKLKPFWWDWSGFGPQMAGTRALAQIRPQVAFTVTSAT